jgi:hypothetical protein
LARAAWNGAGEPFVQPLTRLALAAAWNSAETIPSFRVAGDQSDA